MLSLLIANKAYSSWSLRPWLLLKHAGIPFAERRLSFLDPNFKAQVRAVSPAGMVPVLTDGDVVVWDSLAIAEYVAERFPEHNLWPRDPAARALARSMCAEMHAGFQKMRASLTMNFSASFPGQGMNVAVRKDVDRIIQMWSEARARFGAGGPFLFGAFSVADAYFAPVAHRFDNYAVSVPAPIAAYVAMILDLPAMQTWAAEARAENEFYAADEPYRTEPGPS